MKIPYDCKEQNKLPFLDGIREEDKKVGCFEFQHLDMYGKVVNTAYRLDPSYEGYMVFFPAKLRHMVYPFYETEEPRISIAGNIWCRTQNLTHLSKYPYRRYGLLSDLVIQNQMRFFLR